MRRRRGHDDEAEVPPGEMPEEEEHADRMQRGLVEVGEEKETKPIGRVAPEPVAEQTLLEHDDALLACPLTVKPALERVFALVRRHTRTRLRGPFRAATSDGSPHSCRSFRYGISRKVRASRLPVTAFRTSRAIQ